MRADALNPDSGARGMGQITSIALLDYNQNHPKEEHYTMDDMYDPQKNMKVSYWYLYDRLPQLLSSKIEGMPEREALKHILAGYNWGPTNVREKGLEKAPQETKDYWTSIIGAYEESLKNE
jgi:soluble lytic murein transglycosylase-like protein